MPPKRETSRQVHLSVWRTRTGHRPIGVELGHEGLVNIWLTAMNAPKPLPPGVEAVPKAWDRRKGAWTDPEGDGANSNLKGYDDFRGANVVRLGITRIEDATAILDAVVP